MWESAKRPASVPGSRRAPGRGIFTYQIAASPHCVGMTKRLIEDAGKLAEIVLVLVPLTGGVTATGGSATIAARLAALYWNT